MDPSSELKSEIKAILRQRCQELGLGYLDSEEIILTQLAKHLTPEDIELARMKQEIEARKAINQASSTTSQISQK